MPLLPEGVEYALTASDPIPADLLVKLQENIVGDLHANRPIVLGAAMWQPKLGGRAAGGGTLAVQGDGEWAWGGATTSLLTCDVLVPVGHEITQVRWFYTRGGVASIPRALWSRNLATGAADALEINASDGAGAAWAGATDNVNIIVANLTSYTLETSLNDAAHRFAGAMVTFRKLP